MTKQTSRWTGDPKTQSSVSSKKCQPSSQPGAAQPSTSLQPPPVPPAKRTSRDAIVHHVPPPIVQAIQSNASFQLHVGQQETNGRRESTSWFSSVLIHLAALVIIALFLVPADYGGTGMHELVVRFGDGSDPGAGTSVAIDVGQDDATPQVVESSQQGEQKSAPSSGAKSGDSDQQDGNSKGGQEGPKGSFFGIETNGHEFVYILDMSGSMRGSRYQEAAQELVRSVNELTESQRFFVLLFSDHFLQMFGQQSRVPTTFAASLQNKDRLRRWVENAFQGGGTDPRAAVQLALQMNPSAIFILSDGEFKDPKKVKRRSLLMGDSADVFQIVRGKSKRTPIHAIAFEEPVACENMKRLSFMTGGKYTFIGDQDNTRAEQMLTAASDEMRTGNLRLAKELLQRTIDQYGNTDSGWDARERLARMVFDQVMRALKAGDVASSRGAINQIISNDPNAVVTEKYQLALIQQLKRLTSLEPPTKASVDASKLALELAAENPKSLIQREIVSGMMDDTYNQAVALVRQEELVDAFLLIDGFQKHYQSQAGSPKLTAMSKQLADEIVSRARRVKQTKGDEAYLEHLEALGRKTKGSPLQKSIAPMLASLAVSMAKGASSGLSGEAREARSKIAKELALQLGDPGLVKDAQLKATQNNLRARSMLKNALRAQQSGDFESAVKRYSVLVKAYPDTTAAESARAQLTVLKSRRRKVTSDEFNLEAMIRKNNSARASR